jgi:flagellar operon protein
LDGQHRQSKPAADRRYRGSRGGQSMIDPVQVRTQPAAPAGQSPGSAAVKAQGSSLAFADVLSGVGQIKFSNHAQKRLESRNISLTDDGIYRLTRAVDKAEKRGGKESLVMVDDMAFIVNVKQRLVVTALDAHSRGEGVFTQIDSVVFADPSETSNSSAQTSLSA